MSSSGAYNPDFIEKLQSQFNGLNINTPLSEIKEFRKQLESLSGGNENGIVKLTKSVNDFENKIATLKYKYKDLVPETELAEFETLLNNLKTKLSSMKSG